MATVLRSWTTLNGRQWMRSIRNLTQMLIHEITGSVLVLVLSQVG